MGANFETGAGLATAAEEQALCVSDHLPPISAAGGPCCLLRSSRDNTAAHDMHTVLSLPSQAACSLVVWLAVVQNGEQAAGA